MLQVQNDVTVEQYGSLQVQRENERIIITDKRTLRLVVKSEGGTKARRCYAS